ncbi:MAG: hypothetical protein QNJ63_07910 [Calothrix sp. MO_192.B10]|nr:hypothetical protein [Calothrix sp. MO_192.B10]
MNDFFKWVSNNPIANTVLPIAFIIIVISITLIYIVAFFQGREIQFWPPHIGHRTVNPAASHPNRSSQGYSSASISRRGFIPIAIGTFVGIVTGWLFGQQKPSIPTSQDSQPPQRTEWKMHTFLGKSVRKTILWKAPEMVCNRVSELTNGQFKIELVRTGKTEEILRKVNKGEIQCGYSGTYYGDNYKALYFACAIPFGLNPQQQNAWLYYKKNPDDKFTFVQTIYHRVGFKKIISFPAGATGGQMGGWFNKEINNTDDFDGLKMRIPGLGGDVLSKFGVITHKELEKSGDKIPVDEAVKRLKEGKLDAVEWTGPYDDIQLGLNRFI